MLSSNSEDLAASNSVAKTANIDSTPGVKRAEPTDPFQALAASNSVAKTANIDSTPGVKRAEPVDPFQSGDATAQRDLEEYTKAGGIHTSAPRDNHGPLPNEPQVPPLSNNPARESDTGMPEHK